MANRNSGNDYSEAINAVLSILENYDSDKQFPVYGFGAKMEAIGGVSHCFALNGNIFGPECNGVKGVQQAYWNSIHNTPLYGGTHFSGILDYVNGYAETIASEINQYNQKYQVMLILTDGIINDLNATID